MIHNDTGFLVPGSDVAAYASVMRRLADSQALVETLGQKGRCFAESFTWDRAARETLSHLEEISACI